MSTDLESRPMTEDDIAVFLDSLGDNDLPCEAEHDINGNACTVTVTHRCRLTCKGVSRNVCAQEAKDVISWGKTGSTCASCFRLVSTCWIINPI